MNTSSLQHNNGSKWILDMVHHNPGEPPFESRFLDPSHLHDYGFDGQVFKHLNCVITYAETGVDAFPKGSADREWLDHITPSIEREISAAKTSGLKVFYHLDLFVLPKRIVDHFRDDLCDPESGRILLDRCMTLELHRILFDEIVEKFPEVDGFIIRVGETYLMDTPFHVGNGPIPKVGDSWTPTYGYEEALGLKMAGEASWTDRQVSAYVNLIRFLRDLICVKHERFLIFRTWDIFPDRLHACLDHYLEVTDQIEPHERFMFSIKHTALDFWRRVKVNECLTRGKHRQMIEVQCQREYEGKGAFPNYVMDGVINGFEENAQPVGLKELILHPQVAGVYSWSRGGGWYGPYIKNELWPDLNAYVLSGFVKNPDRPEAELMISYAKDRLGLSEADAETFRQLCLLSARVVLKGRHCEVFDRELNESVLPTACWMRDDRLGGSEQLGPVLEWLTTHEQWDAALAEKAEAVKLATELVNRAHEIQWPAGPDGEFVKISAEYGRRLFNAIYHGWRVLAIDRMGDDLARLADVVASYEEAWQDYLALQVEPACPSLYQGCYFNLPGEPECQGMADSVSRCKNRLSNAEAIRDGAKNRPPY